MATEQRGLVLGGGGVTGIGWEIGLLAGLADAGVDVTGADVLIGTSAGSVVGAALGTGVTLDELYATQLEPPPTDQPAARIGPRVLARYLLAGVGASDLTAQARLGRWSLRAATGPEAERRAVFEARFGGRDWPARPRLRITAVDAETGEAVLWDHDSGVGLVDAVAASCAVPLVWPPMTVNGRRYVDGGVRSTVNADYAAGCSRVLVVAPIVASMRRSGRIGTQLATLGPAVKSVVCSPDPAAKAAIGRNVLDPARRAAAAEAGRRQAAQVAGAVAAVWS